MSSSLILCSSSEPFLNQTVMCNKKWILYDNRQQPPQWLDWEEAPKPNLHQKKVMVTAWWSAASLMHYSFLNPGETITSEKNAQQIDEMHWNLKHCNQHWSTERARFLSMIIPNCTSCNQRFKSWVNWVTKFSSSTIRTSPLTNRLPLFQASPQLFAEKMLPQLAGCRKCFPRVHQILKHGFSHYRNKQTYFSLAKICWLFWFLFWLIKMCWA